jgi:hypothetical protein|uniref:Uncharacterized protein n=1 Tax=viral metagenome TaxID=1070528 RepID=A0A6C0BII1_9ZZZZ
MSDLPGNTILPSEEYHVTTLPPLMRSHKPIVIFATNDVNHHTLFQNGLTQNIVILYDLFECLGYRSYLLQASSPEKNDIIKQYRTILLQDMIKQSMPISLFIEIGMSLDNLTRQYLRSVGAKMVKLYLGNILNIDIETIQNFNGAIFFHHHMVGEIDEIWTSPHYLQHVQYAAILNRTPIEKSRVVPYVWDPCFLTHYGQESMNWTPSCWFHQDIVITDPSISFQKCAFYSLLLAEAFSKKFSEWKGKVHVINGDRLTLSSHASQNILPALSLYQNKRIILHPRKKIHDIIKEHRSACFITHQWNNAYNYMTLELMYCNYPILHNSDGWEQYGYHYSLQKWEEAIQTLHMALTCHKDNMNAYRTHAAQLIWKHSIHHPEIQRRWREILL